MAKSRCSVANRSEKYVLLNTLTREKDDWKVKARVSRRWNVVNVSNKNELMSIEMVLIDENNSYIHATIKSNFAHTFRGVFKEGGVYLIKNFSVIDNKNNYRVVAENKQMIQFYSNTIVKEVTFDLDKIPTHRFDFVDFEKLHERLGKTFILTDVIGEVVGEGPIETINFKGKEAHTIEVELINLMKKTIRITLWGKAIEEYQKAIGESGQQKRIGVFTSNLVKEYNHKIHLSTTPSSKMYFNLPIPEVEEYKSCSSNFPIKTLEMSKKTVDKNDILAKKRSIAAILEETTANFQQDLVYYCLATIKSFSNKNGWNFPACARHKTLAKVAGTKFWCSKCMFVIDDAVARYRLEAEVQDETGSTKFIIFDEEAQKLIGVSAQQLHDMEEEKEEVDDEGNVPRNILNLVGQTYLFQVKITQFNKTVRNQSFTASRVFDENMLNESGNDNEKGDDDKERDKSIGTYKRKSQDMILDDVGPSQKKKKKPQEPKKT